MNWNDKLVFEFAKSVTVETYGIYLGIHKLEDKLKKFKLIKSIPKGASLFTHEGNVVMCSDPNGLKIVVKACFDSRDARVIADKLQKIENRKFKKAHTI